MHPVAPRRFAFALVLIAVAALLAGLGSRLAPGRATPRAEAQAATTNWATMLTPLPGSVLSGSSVTFRWSSSGAALAYSLQAGSTLGGTQYANQNTGTTTSLTVSGLPTNGSTVYVRLQTQVFSGWNTLDYSFVAAGGSRGSGAVTLTSPAPGSTLSGSAQLFSEGAGRG